MKKMIIANITSYKGQCDEAEHYYCTYRKVENIVDKLPSKTYSGPHFDRNQLKRTITDQNDADYLKKKDGFGGFKIGIKINRFNSIEQIHSKLIEKFPNRDIVTYYGDQLFNDMLFIKNGINIGVKSFGEVFSTIPTSVWKDLLPSPELIKIKCENCGKEYTLDEVSYERELTEKRILVKFFRKSEMDEPCCRYFDLTWNVIL